VQWVRQSFQTGSWLDRLPALRSAQSGKEQGRMSDTDSFIDEVNEEVRRDRLFGLMRRYGWIAALAVVAIVGAASWNEYRKAQARAQAEAVGDAMLAALSQDAATARISALEEVPTEGAGSAAVASFLRAAQAQEAGALETAIAELDAIAVNGDLAPVYRQLAAFKSLVLQAETMSLADQRQGFEALAGQAGPFSLLAREQMALLEIRAGNTDEALERYQSVLEDAAVTADLQQRALQVIVALGGTPALDGLGGLGN
jgi:hypothetical protein